MARFLRQACRSEDVTARLGGDEFVILLSRADGNTAQRVSDRIQGLLSLHNMRNPETPISLSLGYAVAATPLELDELVARSDEVMYEGRRLRRGELK